MPIANPAILVVEDDPEMRAALLDVLSNDRCRMLSAGNGVEALRVLDTETPALIITDIRMPLMNGWALIENIQRRPELRRVPVFVFSADPVGPAESRPRIVSFFAKPRDVDQLVDAARTMIGSMAAAPRRSLDRTRAPGRGAPDHTQPRGGAIQVSSRAY